jgi:phospholipid/cholesterol/gamma-HCH transport system substrate-binding protein
MRDPGIRDRGAELQVGILVLFALLALVVGLFWISNTRLGGPQLRIHGIAPEAGQITDDAKVFLLGIEVGEVESVRLDGFRVVIGLGIHHETDLPVDTRGVIRAAGFLGTQMVELIPGVSDRVLVSGDTIQLGRSADLQSLAADLGDETNVILERIEDVLSERTVSDIRESSSAFAAAMRELQSLVRAERESLSSLLGNLDQASARIAEVADGPDLERALANLDTLTTRLATASVSFDSTTQSLASITARLDAGEGTFGKMLTDEALYDEVRGAIANLQTATEEIALLTKDLREHPERYLKDIKISVF